MSSNMAPIKFEPLVKHTFSLFSHVMFADVFLPSVFADSGEDAALWYWPATFQFWIMSVYLSFQEVGGVSSQSDSVNMSSKGETGSLILNITELLVSLTVSLP